MVERHREWWCATFIVGDGLFISDGGNNLVRDRDSHDTYGPLRSTGPGTNANGFCAHASAGHPGNVFRGDRETPSAKGSRDVFALALVRVQPLEMAAAVDAATGFGLLRFAPEAGATKDPGSYTPRLHRTKDRDMPTSVICTALRSADPPGR